MANEQTDKEVLSQTEETPKCFFCGATDKILRHCIKCQRLYCPAHATPVAPFAYFCEDCRPLQVVEAPMERKDIKETYDEARDKTFREEIISKCKHITFEGPDKAFYEEFLANRDSESLRKYVIFYKTFVSMVEEELLTRQIKARTQMFRMMGEAAPATPQRRASDKVKSIRPPKPPSANASKIAEMLKNLNISPEDLAKLMNKK